MIQLTEKSMSTAQTAKSFPGGSDGKESACNAGDRGSIPGVRKFLWRRKWQSTPVFLPGKSHGGRSLVGCSPWGRQESDTTERLHFHLSLSCIGEGNGNPLQCSCLENPRDGGALWAAIYGVAQSRTRLKWLSNLSLFQVAQIRPFGTHWIFWIHAKMFLDKSKFY